MPGAAALTRQHVLVLGGTQFIGRACVAALLGTDRYVVTLLNRGRTRHAFGGRAMEVQCDRQDAAAVAAVLRLKPRWDAVIDFLAFETDDLAPILLCSGHIGLYLVISTDSVYMACDPLRFVRDPHSLGLLESSAEQLDEAREREDRYGQGKLLMERALAGAGAPAHVVALRLPDVLGPHENTGRQHSLITKLVKGRTIGSANGQAVQGTGPAGFSFGFGEGDGAGPPGGIQVGAASSGTDSRADSSSAPEPDGHSHLPFTPVVDEGRRISLVFAEDVAAAIVAVLATPREVLFPATSNPSDVPCGVSLHICQAESPTWPQLVRALAEALRAQGVPVPPPSFDETRDTRFLSVDFGHLEGSRARDLLGYAPAPLAQRLAETAAWWVAQMRVKFEDQAAEAAAAGKRGGRSKRGTARGESESREGARVILIGSREVLVGSSCCLFCFRLTGNLLALRRDGTGVCQCLRPRSRATCVIHSSHITRSYTLNAALPYYNTLPTSNLPR